MADPNAPAPEGDPAPLDQKTLDAFNAIVQSQLSRMLPKAFEAHVAPQLAALSAKFAPPAPEPKSGKGDDDPIAARFAALEKNLADEKAARANERKASHETAAFGLLRSELTGKVRAESVDFLAKVMRADGHLRVGDDGSAKFVIGDAEHDLRHGVAAYLKRPEVDQFKLAPGYTPKGKLPGGKLPARTPPAKVQGEREDPLAKTLRELDELSAG